MVAQEITRLLLAAVPSVLCHRTVSLIVQSCRACSYDDCWATSECFFIVNLVEIWRRRQSLEGCAAPGDIVAHCALAALIFVRSPSPVALHIPLLRFVPSLSLWVTCVMKRTISCQSYSMNAYEYLLKNNKRTTSLPSLTCFFSPCVRVLVFGVAD